MFRIIPLHEIRKPDQGFLKPGDFYIAEYMIYSDVWTISVSDGDSRSYSIYDSSNLIVLTSSFAEFLDRFLNGGVFEAGGLYDWHEGSEHKKTKTFNESVVQQKPSSFFRRWWRRLS